MSSGCAASAPGWEVDSRPVCSAFSTLADAPSARLPLPDDVPVSPGGGAVTGGGVDAETGALGSVLAMASVGLVTSTADRAGTRAANRGASTPPAELMAVDGSAVLNCEVPSWLSVMPAPAMMPKLTVTTVRVGVNGAKVPSGVACVAATLIL